MADGTFKTVVKSTARSLLSDVKNEKYNLRRAFQDFGSDIAARSHTVISRENIRGLLIDFLAVVLIGLVVSLLCSLKEGGMDLYLSVMLPFIIICLFQFGVTALYDSSVRYATLTVILIFLGASLQIMLMLPAEDASGAYKLAIFAGVGTVAGLIGVPLLNYVFNYMNKRLAALLTLGGAAFLYLLLLVAAPNISGTKAWLVIGSVSFQLTEVTKVLAVVTFACIYTDSSIVPFRRLLYAVAALAMHGIGLILVNELGTLVVICIIFVVLGAAFLPSAKGLIAVVLAGLLCVAALVGFSYQCYRIWYAEPSAEQTVQETETETTVEGEVIAAETNAEGEPVAATEPATEAARPAKTHGRLYNKVVGKAADVFYKIRTRLILVIAPESLDEYGEGYQAKMARKAMLVTGWLGTSEEYEQNVPVIESDYIFLYVLMKIGIIGAFIVLAMLIAMMMETVIKVSVGGKVTEAAAAIGFICCIVVQSIITAASSAGLIPTVGLTFAFLSDGGSATVMNYIMTYFILFAMRKKLPSNVSPRPAAAETEQRQGRAASRGAVWRTE
ncbi:MAG: FtsW/RodA/SpoVE family cell cycle protein [Clostridia bacterium]|nr:FtsW/RodA/SpoVE family cell cycle protein [Clostridia bacterium]